MNKENKTPKTIEVDFKNRYETGNVITKDFARTYVEMHLRVCAYARVSTDFEEQQTSYKSQLTHYEGMIRQNSNWEFVDVYADEGITGTQLKKRDNFNRMIQDALDGKIDMIIAKSISRFARNTVDTLNIVRLLRSHNVDVFFEKENIHTISITNELFLTLYSAFAQGESESISENMKGGLQMKMKRGEYIGNPKCYGYDWNKETKELVINKEQMKIVKRIFEEYASGKGATTIAKNLNKDGIPSPLNKKWIGESVLGILHNEKYVGDLRTGKTYVESVITHKKKKNEGQQKQYYTEDKHEAGISRELFDEVNNMYKLRSDKSKQHRDKYSRRYAFSSITYCGCCGQRFVRRSYIKNKNKPENGRVIFWGCRSHQNDIECINRVTYKDEELKGMFLLLYNKLYTNKDKYIKSFLSNVEKILDNKNISKDKIRLAKEKEIILNKQSKLLDLSMDENISKTLFDSKMSELNNNLALIEDKLLKIQDSEKLKNQKNEQINKIIEVLENKQTLEEFDDDVFKALVDKIIIGDYDEEGIFDYKIVKFILKTGETLTGGTNINSLLKSTMETKNEKLSTFNLSIKKINEDKLNGFTAYTQAKRLWLCK